MRTEYLREFVVFSRHLSFTEAAKELFIAQSTLSTHIAALESDVGFSLIDRKAGNRLTDKGAVFLDGARTLLDGLDETLARCREMGDPDATLRIAVQYPTPSFAAKLKERLSVPFAFVEHDYRDPIFQPIVNGTADIVLDYDYTPFASLVKEASALDLVTRTCLAFRMSISIWRRTLWQAGPLFRATTLVARPSSSTMPTITTASAIFTSACWVTIWICTSACSLSTA